MSTVALGGRWDTELIERLGAVLDGCEIVNGAHEDIGAARAAKVLVPLGMPVDDSLLAGSSLRLVQQFGVGYDRIDLDAARRHGVLVANAPSEMSGMADAVADHAVYLVLACARLPAQAAANIAARRWVWTAPLNYGLSGKRVGLIGFGNIGAAVARRLAGFGAELVAVRRTPPETPPPGLSWVGGLDRMEELAQSSDFVVVTAPHNTQSHRLINAAFLARMKPDAALVNVGRGAVVDEDALCAAINGGRLRAAALDTLNREPPPADSPLLGHPRIVVTPHIAGVTETAFDGTARIIADNIARLGAGAPLRFRIA